MAAANRSTLSTMWCNRPIDWVATAVWVQAIIMALAIVAAIGAPYLAAWLQDRSLRKRDEEALQASREAAVALILVSARRLQWLADAVEGAARYTIVMSGRAERALATTARALDSFPTPSLRNAESIASMAEVQGILAFAESYCAEAREMLPSPQPPDREHILAAWAVEFRRMGIEVERHATAMGARHKLAVALLTGRVIGYADGEDA